MDNYELLLSKEAEENIDEAITTLVSAAQDIANKSEQDFERIKEKKWYKRLWELVTFSKDNEKIQARGVANLAKLNEIVMKAIVLLSKQSKYNADKIYEALQQIQSLTEDVSDLFAQQEAIANKILIIRRGFESEGRFDELSDNQRDIIYAVLRKYALEGSNEDTGKLLCVIAKQSHDTYDEVSYDVIKSVNSDSFHKIIFSLLQLYSYLLNDTLPDEQHELFQYIKLSEQEKKTIRNHVEEDIHIYGSKDKYIETFYSTAEEYDAFIEAEGIEWEFTDEDYAETDFDETAEDEPVEVILNEIMHIGAGENCIYKKKKINLRAFIECEGTLIFDNCEIAINDDEVPKSSIELSGNGSIIFNNCKIFMYSKLSDFLISAAKNTSIRMHNCFLNGCGMFIETFGNCEVDSCRFVQPGVNLLSCKPQEDSQCAVKNSFFYQRYYPSHIEYSGVEEYSSILSGISVINNCKVERESDCFSHSQYGRKMAFLNSEKVDISHVTFKNWSNCIRADGVNEISIRVSIFEQCENAISANQLTVENCNFYDCLNPIKTSGKSKVSHCQFYKCGGDVVISTSQVDVKYCLFDTCIVLPCSENQRHIDHIIPANILCTTEDAERKDFYENAMIHISHSKHEKSYSQIVKCRFCNMDLGNTYIIKCNDYVNHKNEILKVSDCEFSNCKSARKDRKIIRIASLREHHSVSPLVMVSPLLAVKKTIEEFENVRLINCVGVCSESGIISSNSIIDVNEFVHREYTASKEKIGCLLEEN